MSTSNCMYDLYRQKFVLSQMSDDVFFILPLNTIRFFVIYYREMGLNHSSYFLSTEYLVCFLMNFLYVYSEKGSGILRNIYIYCKNNPFICQLK